MQDSLLEDSDYRSGGQVRYTVLQNGQSHGKRPFCQNTFKVATVCLTVTCLLLFTILLAMSVHKKGKADELQPSSGEAHMLKTSSNVTDLTAELQSVRKDNSDLTAQLQTLNKDKSDLTAQLQTLNKDKSDLTAQLQSLRKDKSDLESERSQLMARIAKLEAAVTTQITPTQVTEKSSCPDYWFYFNSSCYFISSYSKSWRESQEYCEHKGGHLAIIHTPEEQTFIWNLLPRGHWNAYWIGISDEKLEEDWHWVDGTKLVGGFWEDGEPNNHIDEDCGYMIKTDVLSRVATKSWYDAPCFMYWPWICEKAA